MSDVGLDYLTLGQPLSTLSGGECQRIKLASELHKKGSVYVMDEPTTGLHMSDIGHLLAIMNRLVDAGNTVIVIEHNLAIIKNADWIIDMGPEGGNKGGQSPVRGHAAAAAGLRAFADERVPAQLGPAPEPDAEQYPYHDQQCPVDRDGRHFKAVLEILAVEEAHCHIDGK